MSSVIEINPVGFYDDLSDSFFEIKKGVINMSAYHIVLDLEMNPISVHNADVSHGLKTETIEIGAVKISAATNQIIDEFACVVRPEFNNRIEPNITRLTGITTREVRTAKNFEAALIDFSRWIGSDQVQIYSWSPSDYFQFRKECKAKRIAFPAALRKWTDFQAEYPKYLGCSSKKCLSLKDAAQMIGTTVLPGCAHRALYDARITAKLVLFVLNEEYRHYLRKNNNPCSAMTYSIGDACGSKLTALLVRLSSTEEREDLQNGRESLRKTEAFVR